MVQAFDENVAQANIIAKFFAEKLNTSTKYIEVELIHKSRIQPSILQTGQVEIQMGRRNLNLGHQTMWMVHKVKNIVKKRYPVTVEVYANLLVPTAIRNISRNEIISQDLIVLERKKIGREYSRLVMDSETIMDKMATQMIREGRAIERNMVRIPPDIMLGAELQIILKDQGLSLELPGVAKEEGLIGQEIRVQCPSTRKEFRGVLENINEVVVSLR